MLKQSDLIQRHWDFTRAAVSFERDQTIFLNKLRDHHDQWINNVVLSQFEKIINLWPRFREEQSRSLARIKGLVGLIRAQGVRLKRKRENLRQSHWKLFHPSYTYLINSQKIYFIAREVIDEMAKFVAIVESSSRTEQDLEYNYTETKKKFEEIERVYNLDPEFRKYNTKELIMCKRKFQKLLMSGRAPGSIFC